MSKTSQISRATETRINEKGIIGQIRRRFSCTNSRLLVGLGDDAAVLSPDEECQEARRLNVRSQVLATDILVEGVHFSRDYMSLADIGYKSVAVNASDMAAMGAECVYALGNLGVPRDASSEDVSELLDGVSKALEEFGASLIGGDTVRSPQWLLSFSMIGSISTTPLKRSGARPGDVIWHSGELGLSQLGFHRLQAGDARISELTRLAHVRPRPMLELGQWLSREELASAGLDLSDSLSQCLLQLAEASEVGLQLDLEQYAFHPELLEFAAGLGGSGTVTAEHAGSFRVPAAMQADGRAIEYAGICEFLLACSEDYQLLFTAPESSTAKLLADAPIGLRRLGTVVAKEEGCHYRDEQGNIHELIARGYEH